jgi:hypothetical protein
VYKGTGHIIWLVERRHSKMHLRNLFGGTRKGTCVTTTKERSPVKSDDPETTFVDNRDQAQALANFLWNERHRHYKDIFQIEDDLDQLAIHWKVQPSQELKFVIP